MRNRKLCYFHHRATDNKVRITRNELPNLEDGAAIQLGIARIMQQLMSGVIEYRAAQFMLDAYRLAFRNLKNLNSEPCDKTKIVTVDPYEDPENAGLVNEPATYDQQEELTTRGAFDTAQIAEYESIAAAIVADKQQKEDEMAASTAGAPPARFSQVGTETSGAPSNRPPFGRLGGNDPMSQPGHEELTDQQIDEMVMRSAGNEAYFMPDNDPPRKSANGHTTDDQTMRELFQLAKNLAG
jgi:hypothetical protein